MKALRTTGWTVLALTLLVTAAHAAGGVELKESGREGLSLVYRSSAPTLRPDAADPERVEIDAGGLAVLAEPGLPRLPYARTIIAVPEGTRPRMEITSSPATRLDGAAPALNPFTWFGARELPGAEEAEDLIGRKSYPRKAAEIAWVGWMRDLQVAEIRFYPYRAAGGGWDLVHHSSIEVKVRFVPDPTARPARRGPSAGSRETEWAWYRQLQRRAAINSDQVDPGVAPEGAFDEPFAGGLGEPFIENGSPAVQPLKIAVEEEGLYGVGPSELLAAGVDPGSVDPRDFRLEFLGVPVPIEVTGETDGLFDGNDRVVFFGRGATGRQTRRNMYWLHFDGSPARVTSRDGTYGAAAPTPASFETTVHAEDELIYTQNVPGGAIDHWWWVLQRESLSGGPDTIGYPVTLPNVDPSPHSVSLRVNLQGRTSGTHHTRVFLNGPQVDDKTWNGFIPFDHAVSVASTGIASGANTVSLFVVGDLSGNDQIYSNFVEVTYRRTYDAIADALTAAGEGPGDFRFSFKGFSSSGVLLYDVTDPGAAVKITVPAGQITGAGPFDAGFQESLTADRLYAAATLAGLKLPVDIVQEVPSNLAGDPNGADWIAILPPDPAFAAALQPLVSHRQSQGYRVLVATTEDIYDEFNFGIMDTMAIDAFLTHAWTSYPGPAPEFILLAGDAHIDFLDHYGSGVPQYVPTTIAEIPGFGESPSDNVYATTAGIDVIPEMITGRLPARSAADLSVMVTKILDYETAPPVAALNAKSLFIADNDDITFEAILSSFTSFLPPTMSDTRIYMSQVGAPNMRPQIASGFNTGSLMATYLGHGGATQWASECIWASGNVAPCNANDPGNLALSGNTTFVASLNCINGYFIDLAAAGPGHVDYSLAEAMVRKADGGAIAMWAPAALGSVSDYSSIGDWLFRDIFLNLETVLGRASVMAVVSAVTQPFSPADIDNVRTLTFFGDPATILALDSDADGLTDRAEQTSGSDPLDADTDDDGLADGGEISSSMDPDLDGLINALDPDSDGDGILDGTESGLTAPGPGTNTSSGHFVPDADPSTATDPFEADTDGGGAADGAEDRDFNGRLDPGETDPTAGNGGDDQGCLSALPELGDLYAAGSGPDVELTWTDITASHGCAIYHVYAAPDVGVPKGSFAPFLLLGVTGFPSFTHAGAATDGVDYDYLVVAVDPLTGAGPLGHYGQ